MIIEITKLVTSRFSPDHVSYQWGLGASAKPRKPTPILGSVGAFQFMLMEVLREFSNCSISPIQVCQLAMSYQRMLYWVSSILKAETILRLHWFVPSFHQ
jgi:hypothetical protein